MPSRYPWGRTHLASGTSTRQQERTKSSHAELVRTSWLRSPHVSPSQMRRINTSARFETATRQNNMLKNLLVTKASKMGCTGQSPRAETQVHLNRFETLPKLPVTPT